MKWLLSSNVYLVMYESECFLFNCKSNFIKSSFLAALVCLITATTHRFDFGDTRQIQFAVAALTLFCKCRLVSINGFRFKAVNLSLSKSLKIYSLQIRCLFVCFA